jgi:hypothetical protein
MTTCPYYTDGRHRPAALQDYPTPRCYCGEEIPHQPGLFDQAAATVSRETPPPPPATVSRETPDPGRPTSRGAEPEPGTQKEAVLTRLRQGPLCSYTFYEDGTGYRITHRLAARIYDLKRAGWTITAAPCDLPDHHHQTNAVVYRLHESP